MVRAAQQQKARNGHLSKRTAPPRPPARAAAASPVHPLSLVAAALGVWDVRRKIVDHRAGTTAHFTGRATIAPDRFEEDGHLSLPAAATNLHATRAYALAFDSDSVRVGHPDGTPFIELFAQPAQTVRHQCGADLYTGRFFFLDADTWAEAWRVAGPRKSYSSLSHYRRLAPLAT